LAYITNRREPTGKRKKRGPRSIRLGALKKKNGGGERDQDEMIANVHQDGGNEKGRPLGIPEKIGTTKK